MEAKAAVRFVRVPPRKARYVIDTIRGKNVHDALAILKFTPNAAARVIEKLLKSAVANAENNQHMDADVLVVSRANVDQGPSLKRMQPRAMGRAYAILKRTSHIAIELTEGEEPARRTRRKQIAQAVSKAKPRRGKAEAPAKAKAKAPKAEEPAKAKARAPKAEAPAKAKAKAPKAEAPAEIKAQEPDVEASVEAKVEAPEMETPVEAEAKTVEPEVEPSASEAPEKAPEGEET